MVWISGSISRGHFWRLVSEPHPALWHQLWLQGKMKPIAICKWEFSVTREGGGLAAMASLGVRGSTWKGVERPGRTITFQP